MALFILFSSSLDNDAAQRLKLPFMWCQSRPFHPWYETLASLFPEIIFLCNCPAEYGFLKRKSSLTMNCRGARPTMHLFAPFLDVTRVRPSASRHQGSLAASSNNKDGASIRRYRRFPDDHLKRWLNSAESPTKGDIYERVRQW